MADLHIEDFHQDVARILLALYASFPRPATLFVSDLIGEHEPDAFGVPAVRHQACFSAMLWLADEGFLRFQSTIRQEAIDQCCLTERSFRLLAGPSGVEDPILGQLPPSVARQRASLAQHLRDALASGSSHQVCMAVVRCFERKPG
ncbi:MAG: hypothetical protein WAV92_12885 [Halopseudomonas yangmingensis]|uniref:Uncharacterized protein n=1 Tax=Halopseudomonas yangmingensis TaxID=1720063 RepID=A0A1I4NN17_9GAMM|nr:hypothetical protein [Halopseudomonas yangmingensis]SFM16908.1 hypothetical protein SAMN05216217_101436 [Halopseudomonas yangmingensis]